ncbi:holin, SPP1 family [Virgibacillus subterraneus]|uniref:Holin, SPP1 family n=1 Tax=Virgibacillus subterraneus TaxID=621109 RepID=A0A1H9HQF3_9BACI|nr:phage holin [Virgibacillus subterraneus]SEQ64545.1 holin, SPP1 family [Virgibacillus subterraneus]
MVDKGTVVRTAALLLALVNQCLVMFGKSPLPIDSEMLEQVMSFSFLAVTSISAWFKNNYVTKTGLKQKEAILEKGLNGRNGGI